MKLKDMDRRFARRALEPRYGFPEAGELIARPANTVRRWSLGNKRTYRGTPTLDSPLIKIDGESGRDCVPLSFLNLLELRFLASYREEASLPAIRHALEYAAEQLGVVRPLLEAEFAIHGKELFLRYAKEGGEAYFVNASRNGQIAAWPDSAEYLLESLDYDSQEKAAYRWWPLGKSKPVILDTRLSGGLPATASSGVRTSSIASRARRGWSEEAIASDVAADLEEVRAALELEHAA